MKRNILILILFVGAFIKCNAQVWTYDEEKIKQIRAMEVTGWDFAPDWYYYLFHKGYSGAETYWRWSGLKSGLRVRFKESKSNTKRVMPTRVLSEEAQRQKMKKANEEWDMTEELLTEELKKEADRNIDLTYSTMYKSDFENMQDEIADGLVYVMEKSKGKMSKTVDELSRENEVLCSNIAYIHKTGLGYELENSKRQKAYEEYKKDMEKLMKKVAYAALYADTHF